MSTDQPGPGSAGEPPEHDPYLKKPQEPPSGGAPYGAEPAGGSPYGSRPAGGSPYDRPANATPHGEQPPGGDPYGGSAPPPGSGPPPGGMPPPPYGGDPYGGNPYGGQYGAADPLAGMPPLASRGRRLVARIIDWIIVCVPVGLIMSGIVGGFDYWTTDGTQTGRQASVSLVTMLVYLVYEGLMLTSRGQTVGKMAMKIRVGMLENGAVPAGQAGWVRAAVYTLPEIVPCCGFIFWLVNVLWCTWDKPYQQCLHDKTAKTVVVSTA
ncbi:RDD family protein [Streptomyces chrestomyceticus]|uniref:RDD family protein n=1 Tax=Streptomyces chrestomyceticus TaxID=68185 RepID=A0ABU7WQC0_9ACTN